MIIERYKNDCLPRLDKDEIAYYVDDTNYDIMRDILRNHLYHIDKGYQYVQYSQFYDVYKQYLPLYMYFCTDSVTFDHADEDAYACVTDYTVIKIQKDALMTVE
jgi:hypothetical protein